MLFFNFYRTHDAEIGYNFLTELAEPVGIERGVTDLNFTTVDLD